MTAQHWQWGSEEIQRTEKGQEQHKYSREASEEGRALNHLEKVARGVFVQEQVTEGVKGRTEYGSR